MPAAADTQHTLELLADRITPELASLTEIRHDLHAHPEVRFTERRTSKVVQDELTRLGIAFVAGLGGHEPGQGTGVLAHIPATVDHPGPCIGLRADMDALPIEERTGKPYASTHPGVMHACGHDGHTTILLGVARVLSGLEHRPNPVTLVFQPAEEGGAGGEKMCRDGALTGGPDGTLGPAVTRMYGLHGWPGLPMGVVATKPGPLLASTDEVKITIKGVQGHAAYPHLSADPVVAGAHVVTAAQTIASRNVSPVGSVVVTFGTFHAGTANNVIPESAELWGTIRTLDAETRELAKRRLREIVEGVAASMGCRGELEVVEGYPVTLNDPNEADRVLELAKGARFARGSEVFPEPSMGGEDFSFYANKVPSCFYLVGLKPDGADEVPQLHQPEFDFRDEVIGLGVEMMCRLALS